MANRKLWTILMVGIALVALFLLSSGLADLGLSARTRPFPFRLRVPLPVVDLLPPVGEGGKTTWVTSLSLVILLLLLSGILCLFLSPEGRKAILRTIGLALTLFLLFRHVNLRWSQLRDIEIFGGASEWDATISLTPPAEFLAKTSRWLVWGTAAGLAILATASLWGIGWLIWRRFHREESLLRQLSHEAQQAITSLQTGQELKNVVLRCYQRMIQVLSRERRIERHKSMTPHEFELLLAKTGLPYAAVQRLTRLFEQVRYGARIPDEAEEQEALASLQAIVEACGRSS